MPVALTETEEDTACLTEDPRRSSLEIISQIVLVMQVEINQSSHFFLFVAMGVPPSNEGSWVTAEQNIGFKFTLLTQITSNLNQQQTARILMPWTKILYRQSSKGVVGFKKSYHGISYESNINNEAYIIDLIRFSGDKYEWQIQGQGTIENIKQCLFLNYFQTTKWSRLKIVIIHLLWMV